MWRFPASRHKLNCVQWPGAGEGMFATKKAGVGQGRMDQIPLCKKKHGVIQQRNPHCLWVLISADAGQAARTYWAELKLWAFKMFKCLLSIFIFYPCSLFSSPSLPCPPGPRIMFMRPTVARDEGARRGWIYWRRWGTRTSVATNNSLFQIEWRIE